MPAPQHRALNSFETAHSARSRRHEGKVRDAEERLGAEAAHAAAPSVLSVFA